MTIEMPRGDIRHVSFTVTDSSGAASGVAFTEIYFTVKKSYRDENYLIQKKLSNGTIEAAESGAYTFTIDAADTDDLTVGKYVFDIELIYGTDIKQTTVGELILTNEVTFAANE